MKNRKPIKTVHVHKHVLDITISDVTEFLGDMEHRIFVESSCPGVLAVYAITTTDALSETTLKYTKKIFETAEGFNVYWQGYGKTYYAERGGTWWAIMYMCESDERYENELTEEELQTAREIARSIDFDREDFNARVRLARTHRNVSERAMFEKTYMGNVPAGRIFNNVLKFFGF